ncbi:MAG: hypothetical protein LIO58_03345 [Oscillospiraceae bacterium]|nr:hypothetical protein [Oscillospiraceae bacterium]
MEQFITNLSHWQDISEIFFYIMKSLVLQWNGGTEVRKYSFSPPIGLDKRATFLIR